MSPAGLARLDLRHRRVVGDQLRVHPAFAHPPGDQLRVLAAEIEDQDRLDAVDLSYSADTSSSSTRFASLSASAGENTPAP